LASRIFGALETDFRNGFSCLFFNKLNLNAFFHFFKANMEVACSLLIFAKLSGAKEGKE